MHWLSTYPLMVNYWYFLSDWEEVPCDGMKQVRITICKDFGKIGAT